VCRCTEMRKACDKLVPGISRMIKDNSRYVEVMAKILTPSLVEWDPYKVVYFMSQQTVLKCINCCF